MLKIKKNFLAAQPVGKYSQSGARWIIYFCTGDIWSTDSKTRRSSCLQQPYSSTLGRLTFLHAWKFVEGPNGYLSFLTGHFHFLVSNIQLSVSTPTLPNSDGRFGYILRVFLPFYACPLISVEFKHHSSRVGAQLFRLKPLAHRTFNGNIKMLLYFWSMRANLISAVTYSNLTVGRQPNCHKSKTSKETRLNKFVLPQKLLHPLDCKWKSVSSRFLLSFFYSSFYAPNWIQALNLVLQFDLPSYSSHVNNLSSGIPKTTVSVETLERIWIVLKNFFICVS